MGMLRSMLTTSAISSSGRPRGAPLCYTGRLGIPRFEKLAEIVILRLETSGNRGAARAVSERSFAEVSRLLPRAGYSACDADRIFRSVIEPIHLVTPNDDACGIIEDTRKGKRLFLEDGDEMLSAHLSGLAFASAGAAALLLRGAAFFARGVGLPALFAALPASKAAEVPWPLRRSMAMRLSRDVTGGSIPPKSERSAISGRMICGFMGFPAMHRSGRFLPSAGDGVAPCRPRPQPPRHRPMVLGRG
jgi:hypothetical protein